MNMAVNIDKRLSLCVLHGLRKCLFKVLNSTGNIFYFYEYMHANMVGNFSDFYLFCRIYKDL